MVKSARKMVNLHKKSVSFQTACTTADSVASALPTTSGDLEVICTGMKRLLEGSLPPLNVSRDDLVKRHRGVNEASTAQDDDASDRLTGIREAPFDEADSFESRTDDAADGKIAQSDKVERLTSIDGESTATDSDTSSDCSSRRGSGDDLPPYRGYSGHRRHGRKDSLGTVDFTRLFPNLISDNDDFRYKQYCNSLTVYEHMYS